MRSLPQIRKDNARAETEDIYRLAVSALREAGLTTELALRATHPGLAMALVKFVREWESPPPGEEALQLRLFVGRYQ